MSKLKKIVTIGGLILTGLALYDQLSRVPGYRTWHGDVFGIPYDFRPPTPERIRMKFWNSKDPRVLTPHLFGVGWSINLYQLRERLLSNI